MSVPGFTVTSRLIGNVAVFYPRGYLNNMAGESLVRACNSFVNEGINRIVLNFSGTEFINSIGISLLLNIMEKLRDCGGTLCFTDLSRRHLDTFEMLGLTKFITIYGSEEEALNSLRVETGR